MNQSTTTILKVLIVPLMVCVIFLQRGIDPTAAELHKGERSTVVGLSNEFILGPALGLQQAVAGALWVRADEFFHEGDYDAILPMVRMVTWLDPHQLDVYITGAWHLAYNFTDSSERSDRRYIPASQKLLEEGFQNNPTLYDIPFELGWESSDKAKDYERGEQWYRTASGLVGTDQEGRLGQPAPMFVWHQRAHALERLGRIDDCIAMWRTCMAMTEKKIAGKARSDMNWQTHNVYDSEKHNLELTLKRKFSRWVHEINYDVDAKLSRSTDPQTGEPSPPDAYLATDEKVDGVPPGKPRLPAIVRPWDTAFDGHVTFPEPMIMEPRGQFNVGDGGRVTIRLHDEDWHEKQLKEFTFDIDQTQTIMQDYHSVKKGKWGRKIDMSRDPKMYSFSRPFYYLVFDFNPRGTSQFIQDKFGWSGEGMTDKRYLWEDKSKTPPIRSIRKVFKISKAQIMGSKPVTEADVVSNEEYDRIQRQAESRVASEK